MNASELFTRIWRLVLGDSPRRLAWRAGLLSGLIALVALGSCGKSSRVTNPAAGTHGALSQDAEDIENEAAEENELGENVAANEVAWSQSLAGGDFSADYQPVETPASTTAGQTVVLVGAGDIATSGSGDSGTAKLIDQIQGTVFTAGDNAYSDGSASNFSSYYAPTWGRFKSRTKPAPGNHDYNTSGASAYYKYFGANAGPSGRGYYSYNIGDWHVISLNSNISMSAGSSQEKWLRADLAANRNKCSLAYWHHPRFSSGSHGSSTKSQAVWKALQDFGAEIVVVGHDHDYERFAPMTSTGTKDLAKGIREFVVGTGGTSLRSMGKIANSEARNSSTQGVLKLTLAPQAYQWEFIPVAGKSYRDSGSGTCH